jgi:protein-S-isoprenylcysteine O-methyltransferase
MYGGGSGMLVRLFYVLAAACLLSEVILGLGTRAKGASATIRDRGSQALLWIVCFLGIAAGCFIRFGGGEPTGIPPILVLSAAEAFLLSGLVLRWVAILTLGRSFTTNVAIQPGQRIVRTGVYRYVRHPAYSGLLLIVFGVGLSLDNWLSLLVILVPMLAALLYRIRIEENALVEMSGSEYSDYCRVTRKRLVPGIY